MSVKMEDIPENLQGVVEIIGMEKFLQLSKVYGGSDIYIPIYKKIVMAERNRQIIKEYKNTNVRELARKYNLTRQQIERIISSNLY